MFLMIAVSAAVSAVLVIGAVPDLKARGRIAPRAGGAPRSRPDRPAVVSFLDALEAELRAGQTPIGALERAGAAHGGLVDLACAEHRLGGDAAAGLRLDAVRAGAPQRPPAMVLLRLAACWEVAQSTGAGLAEAVAVLAQGERQAATLHDEVAAAAAEPRATITVLAALPAFGVVLASAVGIDALGWLITTAPGRLCLGAGIGLELAGLWWTRVMIRSSSGST